MKLKRIGRRLVAVGASCAVIAAVGAMGAFLLRADAPAESKPGASPGTGVAQATSRSVAERPKPSEKDLPALEARLAELRKTKTREAAVARASIIYAIAELGNLDARRFLVQLASAPEPPACEEDELERLAAVGALAALGDKDAVKTIQARSQDRLVQAKIQVCSR